jgi:peptidoglycan/xylan/chitin deacetylase (PgdA/CDA1 family)
VDTAMERRSIRVFFRYDDYCATSDATVDNGLIALFGKHGLCCTFAVIPRVTEGNYRDPQPRQSIELDAARKQALANAVRAGSIDVALHGFEHRSNGLAMPHSEFRGISYAGQSEKIKHGKAMLEEIIARPVLSFVPPWNTYDESTLKALRDNGLCCLSANRYGPLIGTIETMRFLPITVELPDLESAVDSARASGDSDPVIGVLMHPYDFRESGDQRAQVDLAGLDRKLAWLKQQTDVAVASVTALATGSPVFDIRRYAANQPLAQEQLVPPFVRSVAETPYYASTAGAESARQRRLVGSIGTYLLVVISGVAGGLLLQQIARSIHPAGAEIALVLILLALGRLLWRTSRQPRIYFRPMLLISLLSGCGLGTAISTVTGSG